MIFLYKNLNKKQAVSKSVDTICTALIRTFKEEIKLHSNFTKKLFLSYVLLLKSESKKELLELV